MEECGEEVEVDEVLKEEDVGMEGESDRGVQGEEVASQPSRRDTMGRRVPMMSSRSCVERYK